MSERRVTHYYGDDCDPPHICKHPNFRPITVLDGSAKWWCDDCRQFVRPD